MSGGTKHRADGPEPDEGSCGSIMLCGRGKLHKSAFFENFGSKFNLLLAISPKVKAIPHIHCKRIELSLQAVLRIKNCIDCLCRPTAATH